MAPKKGAKRVAVAAPAAPEQKSKAPKTVDYYKLYGCNKDNYEAVVEGLKRGKEINEATRQMLTAMIPHSICVLSDVRDKHQAMVVGMMDDVFTSGVAAAEAAVEAAKADLSGAEGATAQLAEKVTEAKAAHAAATDVAEATKADKASAASLVAERKTALSENVAEQKKGDAELENAGKHKAQIETLMTSEFNDLKDGTWDKPANAQSLFKAVHAILHLIPMEDSMQAAMPGSFQKKPADRGSFDIMVLQQCEQRLTEKVAQLEADIAGAEPTKAARANAVEEAQKGLEEAKEAQDAAVRAMVEAAAFQKEAAQAAKAAEDDKGPDIASICGVLDEKKADLENFKDWNHNCFQMLRDAVTKKVVVESATNTAEVAPEVAAESTMDTAEGSATDPAVAAPATAEVAA